MEIAENDSRVLHLLADSGTGYDELYRMNFPKQMYNFGISEENMVAAAAGMATCGKIPFVYTAGAFLAYRSLEFIRDDICIQNLNVKIVGMGSGLAWSSLGPTHHTTEDIGVLRSIPNLTIMSPATPNQVVACVSAAYALDGPVYIKIGMNNEKEFFEDTYSFEVPHIDELKEGTDISIFSSGSILDEVYQASIRLNDNNIKAGVINILSIKPYDKARIYNAIERSKLVVSVEEHNVIGGIGSILEEVIVSTKSRKDLLKLGINDQFAIGYGSLETVRSMNNLDSESIYNAIIKKYKSLNL